VALVYCHRVFVALVYCHRVSVALVYCHRVFVALVYCHTITYFFSFLAVFGLLYRILAYRRG
jgi:hypothetical protein